MVQLARRYKIPLSTAWVEEWKVKVPDADAASEAMMSMLLNWAGGPTLNQSLGSLAFGLWLARKWWFCVMKWSALDPARVRRHRHRQ